MESKFEIVTNFFWAGTAFRMRCRICPIIITEKSEDSSPNAEHMVKVVDVN